MDGSHAESAGAFFGRADEIIETGSKYRLLKLGETKGLRSRLNGGFKRSFFYCSFDDGFGHLAALATLGRNAKLATDVSKRAGATSD